MSGQQPGQLCHHHRPTMRTEQLVRQVFIGNGLSIASLAWKKKVKGSLQSRPATLPLHRPRGSFLAEERSL